MVHTYFFCGEQNLLELDSDDECITLWIYFLLFFIRSVIFLTLLGLENIELELTKDEL